MKKLMNATLSKLQEFKVHFEHYESDTLDRIRRKGLHKKRKGSQPPTGELVRRKLVVAKRKAEKRMSIKKRARR